MWGRIRGLLRAFGALAVGAALVVGVPLLLIVTVGNPFPATAPTLDEIRIVLTQNGQGFANFVIGALAVIVWFVWLQLVVALVCEVVATIRRRETRRLPTAPGVQALAARLVGSFTLATTLVTAPVLLPAAGALDLGAFEPVSVPIGPTEASSIEDAPQWAVPASSSAPSYSVQAAAPGEIDRGGAVSVLVVAGDVESWDIAEAAYGDGAQWKTIVAANPGTSDTSAPPMTLDTELVPAGTALHLPGMPDLDALAEVGVVLVDPVGTPDTPIVHSTPTHRAGGAQVARAAGIDAAHVSSAPVEPLLDGSADETHVVEQGESMWSIAEQRLEAELGRYATEAEVAQYWRGVVDSNQAVSSGDVDLIYPGERLTLPLMGPQDSGDAAVDVPPGDELSEPTASGAMQTTASLAMAPLPADGPIEIANASVSVRAIANETAHNVARSHGPGPAESSAAGRGVADHRAEEVVASAAGGGAGIVEPVAVDATAETGDAASTSTDGAGLAGPLSLAAFGTAMVAAGVSGAIQRRRSAQQRRRVPGTMVGPASSEAAAFETALSHAANGLVESSQGNGWRLLPAASVAAVAASGPMELRSSRDGELHAVALDEASADGADGTPPSFRLDVDAPDQLSSDVIAARLGISQTKPPVDPGVAAVPTSVVLGTDPATGEAVLLDLASAGAIDVCGDEAGIRRFLRGVVLDLAVSDRADDVRVIAVDIAHELADLERIDVVATLPDAVVAAVRCGHASRDSTTPIVVLSRIESDHEDTIDALTALGAVVLAPGLAEAPARVTISGEQARLWPGGSSVQLAAFDVDDYLAVAELIETTSVAAAEAAPTVDSVDEVLDVADRAECAVEPGPVEVKILGPVEIAGAGSFSSVKAIDVVTYLAFHRHGVDADQIKTWVWPPFEPPTDKAFANVLSRARTALGVGTDGNPFLSKAGADRTYRLADEVTTDFDRFRAQLAVADTAADPRAELRALQAALELVRGVPFTGGTATSFAWADNHVRSHVEFVIDEAVHRCADLALAIDDLDTARSVTFIGLDIVPGCEQCFRRRFLVAGADKNRTELRRAMADLERAAAVELGEPEAVDAISSDLLALYDELDRGLLAGSP